MLSLCVRMFLFATVAVAPILPLHAYEADPKKNAALQYWPALVYIPNDARGTYWEVARYHPLTASLQDAQFLLDGSGIDVNANWSLNDLRRGTMMPYCEWGLPIEQSGPNTLLHHTQRARTAIGLLLMSSRVHHAQNDFPGAIQDLNAAYVFCRHVGNDGTLMSWGIHFHLIDQSIAPLAASWIPDLELSAAKTLRDNLEHLPGTPQFGRVLQSERKHWLNWLRRSIQQHDLDTVKDDLTMLTNNEQDHAMFRKVETKHEVLTWIKETTTLLEEAGKVASLPLEEFQTADVHFQKQVAASNPLARSVVGREFWGKKSFLAAKHWEAESVARLAMINAAIALRIEGQTGFNQVHDPFGNGPFTHQASDGGYTLTSKLTIDGKSFKMQFGKNALPSVKLQSQLLVYDPKADALAKINKALATARRTNKRLLLQWGFNGCIPCYRLTRILDENQLVADVLEQNYIHLHLDVANEQTASLRKKYGVENSSVPRITILDAEGRVLSNVKPSETFSVAGNLNPQMILKFLQKWSPEAQKAKANPKTPESK